MARYAMVIDLKKCLGCQTCTVACCMENNVHDIAPWHVVLDVAEGKFPAIHRRFFPRPCQHCRNAPCVEVCPTGASRKRADGIVHVRQQDCIGCRCCMAACPYEARVFAWRQPKTMLNENRASSRPVKGTVSKCTFCMHRIEHARKQRQPVGDDHPDGVRPACNEQCVGRARCFGDLDDPDSVVSRLVATRDHRRLLPEKNTDPSVIYLV